MRLVVNNYCETVKSSNVIGTITGEVEPDRYVIVGNHRDAWGKFFIGIQICVQIYA